jgi:type IX secretion system PorP/SprF family membrane protein
MKKIFTKFLTIIAMILASFQMQAQDIHFSQFYASPMFQNPANCGFFDGAYRFTAIARSQWRSVTVPYRTIGGSADLSFRTGFGKKDMYGVGINVFSDRAGDSQFTTTRVDLNTGYSKMLDNDQHHYISTGIQASYTSAYIDYNKLTFDENFEGNSTTENFAFNTTRYADVSAGMQYTYLPNKTDNASFGAAIFHINQPRQTFFDADNSFVYRKLVLNASATYAFGEKLKMYPKVNFSTQGPNTELTYGVFGRYDFAKTKKQNYGTYLGILNRAKDAIILVTRFDLDDIALTFSYDFNYSKLSRVSRGLGGPELSIQYIGNFSNKPNKKVYCPAF